MAYYETVVIARQDASSAQVDALIDGYVEQITASGGRVSRREGWGLRNLAFRMRKNRKGHYVLLNYEAASDVVAEMERTMRLSEDILRYMTVRAEDLPEEPSVFMQRRDERGRGDRGERGDRGGRGDRDRGDRGDRGDRDRGDRGGRRDDNFRDREGAES